MLKMNITYLTFVTFISIMTVLYTFRCKRTQFKFKLSAAGMAIVNIAIVYIYNIAQLDRLTTISEITFFANGFISVVCILNMRILKDSEDYGKKYEYMQQCAEFCMQVETLKQQISESEEKLKASDFNDENELENKTKLEEKLKFYKSKLGEIEKETGLKVMEALDEDSNN